MWCGVVVLCACVYCRYIHTPKTKYQQLWNVTKPKSFGIELAKEFEAWIREKETDIEKERGRNLLLPNITRSNQQMVQWSLENHFISYHFLFLCVYVSMCRPQSIILRSNSSLHYYSLVAMSRKNHNNRNHNRNKVNTREESDLIKVWIANNAPHSVLSNRCSIFCVNIGNETFWRKQIKR